MFGELGKYGRKIAAAIDETRISVTERESYKEYSIKKRQKKIEEEEKKKRQEGVTYEAGGGDCYKAVDV